MLAILLVAESLILARAQLRNPFSDTDIYIGENIDELYWLPSHCIGPIRGI